MKKFFKTFLFTLLCLTSAINNTNSTYLSQEPSIEMYSDIDNETIKSESKK